MKKIEIERIILFISVVFLLGILLYLFCPNFINNPLYSFIKDLFALVFTAAGLYIANGGLFTWKKQIEYNKKDEAESSLHLTLLKLRDAIKHVRNPWIFPSETHNAMTYAKSKYPEKTDEEFQKENINSYVYEMRWEEISSATTEMEANLRKAEIIWGTEIKNLIKPIYSKISELNIALKQNFNPEFRTKNYIEIHDVMYDKGDWISDREDKFGEEVNNIINEVVNYMNNKVS